MSQGEDDFVLLGIISFFVLLVVVRVVGYARREQPHFNYMKKRNRGLSENDVGYGPSETAIDQISVILKNRKQPLTPEEIDRLAYDKTGTWVMYAHPKNKFDEVQGVLIAEKISQRMHILAYGIASSVDPYEHRGVAERLISGIAWEAVQTGAISQPSVDSSLGPFKSELKMFDEALERYKGAKVEPPPGHE